MALDLDFYRKDVRVAEQPPVHLSVIDIAPPAMRRTLLFLHGFGGQATQWERQIQPFADESRIVAPDLRGHGQSDRPNSPYDFPTLLGDLEALVAALALPERFVIIAHSFGGALAVEYAIRHPARVERLVLVATAADLRLTPLVAALWKLPAPLLERVRRLVKAPFFAPAFVLKRTYDQAMSRWDGDARLPLVQPPTLVVNGHRDILFARQAFDAVADQIPDAQRVVIPISAHLVQLERADAVNRALHRFLDPAPLGWRQGLGHGVDPATERPWIRFYDPGVPPTIVVPDQPLHRFLESAARRFPRHPATRFLGSTLRYRELNGAANRLANVLLNRGIQRGDRVMVLLPNCPQAIIAYYGILKAGAVAVMVDPRLPAAEIARQARDAGAETLIALAERAAEAREACALAGINRLLLTSISDMLGGWQRTLFALRRGPRAEGLPTSPPQTILHWRESLRASSPVSPRVEVGPHDLAVIQYTGGTTDLARGVMLTHRNLVANTVQARHWYAEAQEAQERVLCAVPISHAYGMTAAMNVGLSLAATLILLPRLEIRELLETIQRERPTLFPGVPALYVALVNAPNVRGYGLDSINFCISGAAPLPVEVQEAFEKLTKGRLVEGYGLTEAGPITHANPLRGTRKTGAIGIPLPSTRARIADPETGAALPPGTIGELQVRGPQVMAGYWGDETATTAAFVDDESGERWLRTGDLARADADGFVQIINRGRDVWPGPTGDTIYPRDVEEVFYEHPAVREVAAVPDRGESGPPRAVVVLKPEERASADELLRWAQLRLPPALAPATIEFRESLPRTLIGKVSRRELLRPAPTDGR